MNQIRADLRLGVRGRIGVRKYTRGGIQVPVRFERGKPVWEHVQENLVLDSGLNYGMGGTSGFRFQELHSFVAVGTGSTAPAASQTALDSELARTSSALTFSSGEGITEVATGQFRYRRVRAFDFAQANGNLAEFGGSWGSGSTNLATRSLFKDGGGNPITITKTSSEQLVITYDIEFTASPTVSTAVGPITVTGLGSQDIHVAFAQGVGAGTFNAGLMWSNPYPVAMWIATAALNMNYSNFSQPSGYENASSAAQAYTDGNFYRDFTMTAPAGTSDTTIYGFGVSGRHSNTSVRNAAFKVSFDTPFTKDKDYKLTLTLRVSVARA